MTILAPPAAGFEASAEIVVIGAGACGMVAALAAEGAGGEVVLLERDAVPSGSTALSSGLIPACATAAQKARGVSDDAATMAADILAKAHGETDAAMVAHLCRQSTVTIDWLNEHHGLDLDVIDSFLYPGHSAHRMHGTPSRTGGELIGALTRAVAAAEVPIVTDAHVTALFAESDGKVRGVRFSRPDGGQEDLGCGALILACNGFGGNPAMVAELIPEMADADYFGHRGNQGDAIVWGRGLGAELADLASYQGHGSVAQPHGILITWALMMEGAIQVNLEGRRFSNEHAGYSEQARKVIAQPGGKAWNLFDAARHQLGMEFEDYRQAFAAGAVKTAGSVDELAAVTGLPAGALAETLADSAAAAAAGATDNYGRTFAKPPLSPPYHAVLVTGALFHTQGGLSVDGDARVLRGDGQPLPNLFAGGGAARGLSGPSDWGYLSGNGLLTAVTLGHIAGLRATELTRATS
ncbi:MAG: FAD-dependent oxidoreductase [Pseudomonadota bacterium]|nr:FAD-dependent oxidoreductase [Pseudomonadota bacterium]